MGDPISQRDRAYPSRISDAERARVAGRINTGWTDGVSVDHSFATAWDRGTWLPRVAPDGGSPPRSRTRVVRPITPTRRGSSHAPREVPVLVSWRVEDREVDQFAVEMFQDAFAREGLLEVVHADSGPAMRSTVLNRAQGPSRRSEHHPDPQPAAGLQRQSVLGIGVPHNEISTELPRHVLRHRAGSRVHGLVCALKQRQPQALRHCPVHAQRGPRRDLGRTLGAARPHSTGAYYQRHPERFRSGPSTPAPAGIVGTNLPKPDTDRLQAG